MVKAVCRFNPETVKKMSARLRNKTLIGSIVFGAFLLFFGVFNIISSLDSEGSKKWLFLILGIIICGFSVYPIIATILTHKRNYRETLKAMELEKGELTLEFVIKEKKMEIKAIQAGEVQNDTVLIRNLSHVKLHHDGVGIYLNENMYFIGDDDIVLGNRDALIRIFKNANIEIKKW